MIPGEIITIPGEIELNKGAEQITIEVARTHRATESGKDISTVQGVNRMIGIHVRRVAELIRAGVDRSQQDSKTCT